MEWWWTWRMSTGICSLEVGVEMMASLYLRAVARSVSTLDSNLGVLRDEPQWVGCLKPSWMSIRTSAVGVLDA